MKTLLLLLNGIAAQFQMGPQTAPQAVPGMVYTQGVYAQAPPVYAQQVYAQAQAPVYTFPQNYAPAAQPYPGSVVKTTSSLASAPTASVATAKKAADDAEKKRQAQYEAQQGIIDARIVDNARDIDVFGAGNLINGILTNPLVADTAAGVSAFGGTNGIILKSGSTFTRLMSRRRVAKSYQRQAARYVAAHPDPTKTDYLTVSQFRAKRDENNALADSFRTSVVSNFVPSSNKALSSSLSAVASSQNYDSYIDGSRASNNALALARDKYLKNTSDVTNRQGFNHARDFKIAEDTERRGAQADKLNAVLPLVGGVKNPLLTAFGVLSLQSGVLREKDVARRQLRIAEDKYDADPSEDNRLKLKLAQATFDYRDFSEQSKRSKGFGLLASSALPSLAKNIFAASATLRYKDQIAAQKRISRLTLQIRKRDYAKKYESTTTGADQTQQRLLALSSYGTHPTKSNY